MSKSERVVEELIERAGRSGERGLEHRDYLSRYTGESDDIDDVEVAKHGLNRILYALDVMGGEGEKPASVHLLTGVVEIFIAWSAEDGGD